MKQCRICRGEFEPRHALQTCCSPICVREWARQADIKKRAREERRAAPKKERPISQYLKDAQREFNRWIVQRDFLEGCISCDAGPNYEGQFAAGHYRTTAAAAHLRFHPDNAAKQCGRCNHFLSGNIIEYRKRLVQKIGAERVEALENNNDKANWTREGLAKLRVHYLQAWRDLKNAREQQS